MFASHMEIQTTKQLSILPLQNHDNKTPSGSSEGSNGALEQLIRMYQKPLSAVEKLSLAKQNTTFNIEEHLDVATPRPSFPMAYSDILHTLRHGDIFIAGLAEKRREIDLLTKGDPLDYSIGQNYVYLVSVLDAPENGKFLRIALESIASNYVTRQPIVAHYAREVIFQRSFIELGYGIDIAQLMVQHNLMDADVLAVLPKLELPAPSAKLQAFAEKVKQRRAA